MGTILNVDRSCHGTPTRTSFGGIFRNNGGLFLSAFSGMISHSNGILLAELTTIYHWLRMARAVKMGRAVRAGLKARKKMKGLGRKIAARIISGLFSPAQQSPKPGRASPSGLRAARKPAKKLKCVIFYLHWTGLLDVVNLDED